MKSVSKDETIICRCNDVTLNEVLAAIHDGCHCLESLKRQLRIGMGPCQGRGCLLLVARILSEETGKPIDELRFPTPRVPLVPTPLHVLAVPGWSKPEGGDKGKT